VNTVQIRTFKKLDLQRLQNRQPVVYELGASWKIIDVILDGYMSAMTMDKLEAIRKVTNIMTMTLYYSDGTTQAEQYSVRIDPGAKSHYLAGNRSAQDQLGLVFYEAQSA
jgi:nitrate reductase NapAB chaperone NapD